MEFKSKSLAAIILLAILITLLSFSLQRSGPEIGYRGADCKPDCAILKLNAGWPLPYVYDSMGVSVVNVLHLEDEFRPIPFLADIVFYWAVLILLTTTVNKLRKTLKTNRE